MTEMTRILTKYLYLGELFLFAPDKHWRPIEVEATDSKDDTVTAMMLYNMVEDIMPFCAKIVKEAGIDCIEDDIFSMIILSPKIIFLGSFFLILLYKYFFSKLS